MITKKKKITINNRPNLECADIQFYKLLTWASPINLNIIGSGVKVTAALCDNYEFIIYGNKYQANVDTLVLNVRDIPDSLFFLGFLPEVGIMVLVPSWYYVKEEDWERCEKINKEIMRGLPGKSGQAGSKLGRLSMPLLRKIRLNYSYSKTINDKR